MAGRTDQMKVPGMAVRRFEAEAPFAEIDLPGDARVDHPLQGPVDRGTTDPRVFAANKIAQIIRAQMTLLAQEEVQYAVAFSGTLAAGRAQAGKLQGLRQSTLKDEPQPQVEVAFGFLMVKPPPVMVSTKSTSAPFR